VPKNSLLVQHNVGALLVTVVGFSSISLYRIRYLLFVFRSGVPRMVYATLISVYVRPGPSGCFRAECCTGDDSMAAPRLNFLPSTPSTSLDKPQLLFFNSSAWPSRNRAHQPTSNQFSSPAANNACSTNSV